MNTRGAGPLLQKARLRRLLSQEEVAARAGISVYTLSNVERGVHAPRPKNLVAIVDAIGLDEHERWQLSQKLGLAGDALAS